MTVGGIMSFAGLTNDKPFIFANIKKVGTKAIVLKDTKVYIPVWFEEEDALVMSSEVSSIGCFVIAMEGRYAVFSMMAMCKIEPTAINQVKIDDDDYYELVLEAGAALVSNIMVVKSDTVPSGFYETIVSKGRVPDYINYVRKLKLFRTSQKYAGLRLGATSKVMEMVIANTCRDPNDMTKYFRQVVTADTKTRHVDIPFNNVVFGATNTTARIAGSNAELGIVSALVNPSMRTEAIETALRV